jgi:hypothetical protein
MILVRKGDLFERGHEAYARGVRLNPGADRRGLALKFNRVYPDMEARYRDQGLEKGEALGDVFCYDPSDDRPMVFNLVVQDGPDRVRRSAFEAAIETMYGRMQAKNLTDVGMPRIGAGHGGLTDEQFLEGLSVIRKDSRRHVTVYEYTSYGAGTDRSSSA